jgi:hypothetical protein
LIIVKVLVQERQWVAAGDRRGSRVLRPCIKGLICCRIWQKKIIRGRWRDEKVIGERRRGSIHRRHRIRAVMLAVLRTINDKFHRF